MKKKIILFIYAGLLCSQSFSQNYEKNLQKYWYYRARLTNNFMKIGDCPGCSLPASARGLVLGYQQANTIGWGDTPILLGEYIGVLATEYKLLKNSSQNVEATKRELYYALQAFNRLDYTAETYFKDSNGITGSPALNGFFIKDDVPADFVCTNYPLVIGTGSNAQYDNTTCEDENYNRFNNKAIISSNPYLLPNTKANSVCGERFYCYDDIYNGKKAKYIPYPHEETIDQVLQLLVGLALVQKSVDSNDSFNNLSFMDGETGIKEEALAIARRMVLFVKNNAWQIINPITGKCAHGIVCGCDEFTSDQVKCPFQGEKDVCLFNFDCGMSALIESYGIQKAMEFIDPIHQFEYDDPISDELIIAAIWDVVGGIISCPVQSISTPKALVINSINSTFNLVGNPNIFATPQPGTFDVEPCQELTKFLAMAAIGDFWNSNLIQTTGTKIKILSSEANASTPGYPLVHSYLHNGLYPVDDGYYTDLLNEAPCKGPHKYHNGSPTAYSYESYEWSCSDRLRHSEGRGRGPNKDAFNGEYSGIDYMLLFNLYCLKNDNYVTTPFSAINFDLEDSKAYPFSIFSNTYGDDATPLTVKSFDKISSNAFITSNGNVTYRAGEKITLEPGFLADAGSKFETIIDNFECTANNEYMKTNNQNGAENGENTGAAEQSTRGGKFNSASDNGNQTKDVTVNPKDQFTKSQFDIQPNPNNGQFTLTYAGVKEGFTLEISDILGQIIFSTQTNEQKLDVNLTSQPRGIYFVRVQNQTEWQVKKIVVQ